MGRRSPQILLEGGAFWEAPRWHAGCWWVSDFFHRCVSSVEASGREQLVLTVDNAIAPPALPARPGDAYGGLAIVRAMARLFGWDERACGPSGERFIAEWSLPASEGTGRGDAD